MPDDIPNDVPRLMGVSDRTAIIGATGTGKTVFAKYILSKQDFSPRSKSAMPWIILDFKREDFNSIKAEAIGYEIPKKPGLYILQPHLNDEKDLHDFLWDIWNHGRIGIFCDEGYMIPAMNCQKPFRAILTQGRSKKIPMINLSQRPVQIDRFILSEAQFIQVFHLNDVRDYDTVEGLMPSIYELDLPEFHSWYWDVKRKSLIQFSPAPPPEEIEKEINQKLFTRMI